MGFSLASSLRRCLAFTSFHVGPGSFHRSRSHPSWHPYHLQNYSPVCLLRPLLLGVVSLGNTALSNLSPGRHHRHLRDKRNGALCAQDNLASRGLCCWGPVRKTETMLDISAEMVLLRTLVQHKQTIVSWVWGNKRQSLGLSESRSSQEGPCKARI